MATCLDKILCENAFGCNITLMDSENNIIDPIILEDGEDVIIALGEKQGYNFIGFVDENGTPYQYETLDENHYRINSIVCSKQYIAKYCAILYTVNVMPSNSCFLPYTIHSFYGDIVQISAPDSNSCRFLYWEKDGVLYSEEHSFEYVVTGNTTFLANYESVKYRITAKPNKINRGVCTGSGIYDLNTNVQISATENEGYYFERWDDGITDSVRTVSVDGNKTYLALFGVNESVVVLSSVPGGAAIGGGTYKTGDVVSLQAIPDAGWVFSHWVIDNTTYNDSTVTFVADKNVTATPYFNKGTYQVTFNISPNGKGYLIPIPEAAYSYGDNFEIEAFPLDGYTFAGWSDGFLTSRRTITVYGNAEYTAMFKPLETQYKLSVVLPNDTYKCSVYIGYDSVGGKYGDEIWTSAMPGTQLKIAPVVPDGKRLVSVTDSEGEVVWINEETRKATSPLIYYTMDDSNTELTLNFIDILYSMDVTISPMNEDISGTIPLTVVSGSIYDTVTPTTANPTISYNGLMYGANVMLSAPSFAGTLAFSYWFTSNGSYTTPTINITVDKNLKCVAVFAAQNNFDDNY